MRAVFMLTTIVVILAGCRADHVPARSAAPQALRGTAWRFIECRDVPVADPASTELAFAADGNASGTTGCNRFSGAAVIADGRLLFSPLVTTRRACPPDLAEQEDRILKLLEEVRRYDVQSGVLRLRLEDGSVLARLTSQADPAAFEPGTAVSLRGVIAEGTECPMLLLPGGRRVSLAGDLAGHGPGNEVCVRGTVAEMSMCMAGEATIVIESIGAAETCP